MKLLPKHIHPLHMATLGASLAGELALANFPRLQDLLIDKTGKVAITLQFGEDEEKIPYLQGKITAHLILVCQRCLGAVDYTLETAVNLSPVLIEDAARALPSSYEPLLLQEDKALLVDIIEEEILLSLPFAPKHEGQCPQEK